MAINKLTNVSLTDSQKQVLSKVISAATPLMGGREARNGRQYVEATKVLINLGLMTYKNDQAEVTDAGKQVMKQENLIDDSDQLTQRGNQMKMAKPDGVLTTPPPAAQNPAPAAPGADSGKTDDSIFDIPSFESFDLLKDLTKRISVKAK